MTKANQDGQPLVTVVVPAWNAEQTVAATLESVASQTYRNLEIIVVDDGSTDRTAAVAEAFCANESRARLIRKSNGGVASARNCAISEARGDWVAPIDADDLWHPTKIEKQVEAAYAAPDLPGFVYCWRRLIDRDDRIITSGERWALQGSAFRQLAYINVVECGSSLLAWREAVLEVGGYDESLRASNAQGCEDMLLQLQLARRFPVAVVREHLVGWRQHDRNMSSDFDQMARSCSLVFRRLAAAGTPVPARAARWMKGRVAFEIAEERLARGKFAAGFGSLARAVALDPLRCGIVLAHRAIRSANRRLNGTGRTEPLPRFDDADPTAVVATDPHAIRGIAHLLQNIDKRRMSQLAIDETALKHRSPDAVRAGQ